ncbi:MAG: isoleucine--tRNA ligase [Litorimonas sp.]
MTDSNDTAADSERDYRETLFLPKTDFPMRAGLPKAEPKWLERWDKLDLYKRQRAAANDAGQWTLHDGPPYANGHIHMGTALNKVHKDIINRSQQMAGHDANYVPGWDCHGLPIEWKVEEEFRSKGRNKDDVPPSEFRARCREYAAEWVAIQKAEFKRLGVIGDWENPYLTMRPESEADICAELLKIARTGQLYRGSKPIMWSPVEQTALAEAEVEYADRKATQIYVKFPVRGTETGDAGPLRKASIVIWTTTPWTIPANRAVSFSSKIKYSLYEVSEMEESEFEPWSKPGDKLLIAEDLASPIKKAGLVKKWQKLGSFNPENLILDHPLKNMAGSEGKYDFPVPLLEGDHVTADAGTGFVHTAPSHGEDDYNVWVSNQKKLEALGIDPVVPMTMDDKGCYTDVMPTRFQGLDVIRTSGKKRGQDGKANGEVLKALVECGNLLARGIMMLRDAHSWRSKAPVIRRATPQWFISMSKDGLRDKAMAAIDETQFWPPRAKNRLSTMVADRPDWLISRQRAWGVPITLMVHKDGTLHTERADADAIDARILAAVRKDGVDGWFDTPAEDFLGEDATDWEKVTDILDVWFDSGCTHAFCLKTRDDLPDRADLYLEGSDQHRGWFQSSLLESCAVYGEAPYKGVMTDGFVVDEKGLKMSKSLGNTMSPLDLAKQYGVEIIRLWVVSSDTTNDLKIGKEIIQTNVDSYRKLRNTLRYMIGALDGYSDAEAVSYDKMPALEKWVLHRLSELTDMHTAAVADHDHRKIFSTLFNFCTGDLSSFYFDIRKDALYCDPLGSTRRRACRTVMNEIFLRLTTWLAPIMCFTMEEVWQARFPSEDGSVHLEVFKTAPGNWKNDDIAKAIEGVQAFRDDAFDAIEALRREGAIKSSLEASIRAGKSCLSDELSVLGVTDDTDYTDPTNPSDVLADYLIVSKCQLSIAGDDMLVTDLKAAEGWTKCDRSWKYFQGEGDITARDAAAVTAFDA